jgi:hypothetical protein
VRNVHIHVRAETCPTLMMNEIRVHVHPNCYNEVPTDYELPKLFLHTRHLKLYTHGIVNVHMCAQRLNNMK